MEHSAPTTIRRAPPGGARRRSPGRYTRAVRRVHASNQRSASPSLPRSWRSVQRAPGHLATAPAQGLRVAVSYPASLDRGPIDGRLLLLVSTDPTGEPRFQISETRRRASRSSGSTSRAEAGRGAVIDASVLGYPLESLADVKPGDVPRAGAAPPVRDVPPRRRPHREAADGPRRGPAVEPRARQPLSAAATEVTSIPRTDEVDRASTLDR